MHKFDTYRDNIVKIPYGHQGGLASAYSPLYFQKIFVTLFPWYDGSERSLERHKHGNASLTDKRWAKALLMRHSHKRFRLNPEFIACASNVFLRREQQRALNILVKKHWFQTTADHLANLKVEDSFFAATTLGQSKSVKQTLCSEQIPEAVKLLVKHLDLSQRSVPYTTANRRAFRWKFAGLRIWDGSSVICWSLNPSDVSHELVLSYICDDVWKNKRFE